MNGQEHNYKKLLKNTPGPISLSSIPYGIRHKDMLRYAEKKGVSVADLSKDEKEIFVFKKIED